MKNHESFTMKPLIVLTMCSNVITVIILCYWFAYHRL